MFLIQESWSESLPYVPGATELGPAAAALLLAAPPGPRAAAARGERAEAERAEAARGQEAATGGLRGEPGHGASRAGRRAVRCAPPTDAATPSQDVLATWCQPCDGEVSAVRRAGVPTGLRRKPARRARRALECRPRRRQPPTRTRPARRHEAMSQPPQGDAADAAAGRTRPQGRDRPAAGRTRQQGQPPSGPPPQGYPPRQPRLPAAGRLPAPAGLPAAGVSAARATRSSPYAGAPGPQGVYRRSAGRPAPPYGPGPSSRASRRASSRRRSGRGCSC